MGINLAPPPSQTPPAGDQANAVVTGSFTAAGPGSPFSVFGWFNVALWGSVSSALTTTSGSGSASVASGSGITQGMTVNSPSGLVPPGTTWATFSGTSGTFAFPPGYTAASVTGGTDSKASYATVAATATVQLEKTYDGGATWIIAYYAETAQPMVFTNTQTVSLYLNEVERGVSYRFNCVGYTAGTANYRMSASGLGNTGFGPRG